MVEEEAEDATVFEPAMFYDYSFVKNAKERDIADNEAEVQQPGVETAYGWPADDAPPLTA